MGRPGSRRILGGFALGDLRNFKGIAQPDNDERFAPVAL
jgi:hypothetical protein